MGRYMIRQIKKKCFENGFDRKIDFRNFCEMEFGITRTKMDGFLSSFLWDRQQIQNAATNPKTYETNRNVSDVFYILA